MPLETKKVLWTVISIAIVLVAASGIAVALFLPPAGAANAPASIAGSAAPRAVSPDSYVRQVEPAPIPSAAEPASSGDSIIIIYGDKPASDALAAAGSSGAAAPASAGSVAPPTGQTAAGSYTPAPPAASKPSSGTAAAAKPSAKPSAPKSVTVTEYWIQAGSFTTRSRAEDVQRDIAAKGLSSIISLSEVDGRSWYRVRIGPYAAKAEADSWLIKIRALPDCDEAYVSQQTVQRSS